MSNDNRPVPMMTRQVSVVRPGHPDGAGTDSLAVEEPLEVRLHKTALTITMRTPGHDHELAAGLLLTEGVLEHPDDLVTVEHCDAVADPDSVGNIVVVTVRSDAAVDLSPIRRGFYAASSCGVCGKASIEQIRRRLPPLPPGPIVTPRLLHGLPAKMRAAQAVFQQTGGLHAAALFDVQGRLECLREDVGRHNAVDKVIGWAVLKGTYPLSARVLLVSGRASFEIVQKAARAGVEIVAAVSAASSLAVELARAANQTLIGFLREGRMSVYAGAQRLNLIDGTNHD